MENKYNDNELDRWLLDNSGTGNPSPAPDGWDTPPETVWTGLRAGLDARKKRRRWALLLWSVLLLSCLSAGIGYWYHTQQAAAPVVHTTSNVPAETKLPPSADNPQLLSESNTTQPKPAQTTTTVPTESRSQTLPAGTQTNKQTNTSVSPKQAIPTRAKQSRPAGSTTLSQPENAPANGVQPGPELKPPAAWPTDALQPAGAAPQAEADQEDGLPGAMPVVPLLPKLPLSTLQTEPMLALARVKIESPNKPKIGLYAAAVSGMLFTSRNLKSQNGKMPNGTESGAWTWQYGLQLGLQLNRHWSLETGLQRSSIRLEAERQIAFQYNSNDELFRPDQYLYRNTTDQVIQTSFGEVEMRMEMGREPSRPILNQTDVQILLRTEEQVNYLRIPLLLRYHSGTGPWQWSLFAGAGVNFEAGYALNMTAARPDRPGVRNISARAQNRANSLASLMLDAQFGAGLEYRFGPAWSLRLSPEFRYGLSPMNKTGNFQSRAIAAGLQLGILYTIK